MTATKEATSALFERLAETDEATKLLQSNEVNGTLIVNFGDPDKAPDGEYANTDGISFEFAADILAPWSHYVGDDGVSLEFAAEPADVTIRGRKIPFDADETTVLTMERETYEALLDGDLFSSHYLDGDIHARGHRLRMMLFAQLLRINRERLIADLG